MLNFPSAEIQRKCRVASICVKSYGGIIRVGGPGIVCCESDHDRDEFHGEPSY